MLTHSRRENSGRTRNGSILFVYAERCRPATPRTKPTTVVLGMAARIKFFRPCFDFMSNIVEYSAAILRLNFGTIIFFK